MTTGFISGLGSTSLVVVPVWWLIVVAVCWIVGTVAVEKMLRESRRWGLKRTRWVVLRWGWLAVGVGLAYAFVLWWVSR